MKLFKFCEEQPSEQISEQCSRCNKKFVPGDFFYEEEDDDEKLVCESCYKALYCTK